MRIIMTAIVATLLATTPALARDLAVPPDKGWQHAETGLVLTAKLDGLARTKLIDETTNEHDVIAEFADPDRNVIATVYLFHPAIDDVAIWFDRSQTAIEARDVYGGATPVNAAPLAFAPPGATVASALRQVYSPHRAPYRATALAMIPTGDWLVAIRMSATTLDPAALDLAMSRIIGAIRWPSAPSAAPAAMPVTPCTTTLRYTKAKLLKPSGSHMLLTLLGGAIASSHKADDKPAPHQSWCRDAASAQDYGVYRTDAMGDSSYALAILDAGRAVFVQRSIAAQIGEGESYSVSLIDVDRSTVAFPSFDRLPQPAQVAELVFKGQPLGRSTSGKGKTDVQITPAALN